MTCELCGKKVESVKVVSIGGTCREVSFFQDMCKECAEEAEKKGATIIGMRF
jgi:ribosome-binding protein aMBF1 (putative translation factor)